MSGCIEDVGTPRVDADAQASSTTSVFERAALPFNVTGDWSWTLEPGPYEILPALEARVNVRVPLMGGVPDQIVHLGVFLPDVPEGTKVPVVADVGPYYGDGDTHATDPANRLGRFLIENLVPHGYAVAQVSVLGTGDSEGCMDFMGPVEQAGIQQAIDWLGQQPWSNGNVGLIGRSYDGSTPWEAAMVASANRHLKTIVPISGLTGVYELMWRNGSAESRAPALIWGIYYISALNGNQQDDPLLQARQIAMHAPCADAHIGLPEGAAAYVTGDWAAPQVNSYWKDRYFLDPVLKNYQGSVYFIHGMQDWNVDPHMAFPAYQWLEDAGLEVKGLFGQWAHNYPDRLGEHEGCDGDGDLCRAPESVRYDWAQDLLEWFDHYLKGTGDKPALHAEIQDGDGRWRVEETWPPAPVATKELALGSDMTPDFVGAPVVTPATTLTFTSDALEETIHVAGLPQFHVTVTPTGPGGQIYAELRDVNRGAHLGHAIMDLRFFAGGQQSQRVTPGMPIVAKMEFEPMDVVVPAGHKLELVISSTGWGYLPSVVTDPVFVEVGAGSVLRLPVVDPAPEQFFHPPGT